MSKGTQKPSDTDEAARTTALARAVQEQSDRLKHVQRAADEYLGNLRAVEELSRSYPFQSSQLQEIDNQIKAQNDRLLAESQQIHGWDRSLLEHMSAVDQPLQTSATEQALRALQQSFEAQAYLYRPSAFHLELEEQWKFRAAMEAGGFTAIYDPDRELLTRVVHAHASAQLSGQSKEQIREAIENVVVDHFEREDCRRLAELVERIKLPAAVEPWRVQLDQTLEAYRGGLHEIASFAPVMIIEGASVGVARRMAQFLDKNGELDMAIEDWLQETGKVKPASKADQIRSCRNQMLARPSHAQVEGLLRASLSFVNAVPQLHGIYSALDFVRGKLYRHASGVPDGPDASRQLLSHYGLGSGKIATLQALLILEQISALLGMLDADLAEGGVA